LLALCACPKGQVGASTGEGTSGTDASASAGMSTTTAAPTTGTPTTGAGGETSTGAGASTGSSGAVDGSSTSGGGSTSTGVGTSTSGGSSTGEVGSSGGGSSSTGEAQQLFDCFGCTCDAQVSFCRQVFAGFKGPEPGACPVVPEEGLQSGCVLYPVDCEPPSCDCLPLMNNNCFCNEQGPGEFEVTCPLP